MGVPAKGQVIVLSTDVTVVREVGEKRDVSEWFERSTRIHLESTGKTLLFFFGFWFSRDRVSLSSSGCPGTCHVN